MTSSTDLFCSLFGGAHKWRRRVEYIAWFMYSSKDVFTTLLCTIPQYWTLPPDPHLLLSLVIGRDIELFKVICFAFFVRGFVIVEVCFVKFFIRCSKSSPWTDTIERETRCPTDAPQHTLMTLLKRSFCKLQQGRRHPLNHQTHSPSNTTPYIMNNHILVGTTSSKAIGHTNGSPSMTPPPTPPMG